MEVLLRKNFWVIYLAFAALGGLLIGRAAVRYFEAILLSSQDLRPLRHRVATPVATTKPYAKDADEIVRRNPFCTTCPLKPERSAAARADQPTPSSLQLELVSTMVVPEDPAWSMAVIRDTGTKEKDPVLYNRGKTIANTGATVALIVNRKVYFYRGGRLEFIDMEGTVPPTPVADKTPAPGPAPDLGELDKGIVCQGPSCTIERALVDRLLSNPNALSSARFVPSVKGGMPNGFKVYAIRPSSLFAKIGLQNGDTIKSINGMEITSPDRALEVYAKLRSASHLGVQLDRRGEVVTLDYTIR